MDFQEDIKPGFKTRSKSQLLPLQNRVTECFKKAIEELPEYPNTFEIFRNKPVRKNM